MKAIVPSLRRNASLRFFVLALIAPGIFLQPVSVTANPYGARVVSGGSQVSFQGMGTNHLTIRNGVNGGNGRAIINWQSFSIPNGSTTTIDQAARGFTLNRVVSGNPTAIYGQLRATAGGVAVINPNGILVGPTGVVNVPGMAVLSTLDINDKDFLNGGRNRFRGNTSAGVVNYGAITSEQGDVVLLGNFLQNSGSVSAPQGTVAFGAGGDIIVDQAGGATISVQAGGPGRDVGIENTGQINAAAAELKAHGNVYALAIKNDGLVRASGYNFQGGRLTLSGGPQGRVVNTGQLVARNSDGSGGRVEVTGGRVEIAAGSVDAAGEVGRPGGAVAISGSEVSVAAAANVTASGSVGGSVSISGVGSTRIDGAVSAVGSEGLGGRVTVEGAEIAVGSQAAVDVSGQTGGGTAMVGGGFQGRDESVRNADSLRIDDGATLSANALASGVGGNVILWADGDTLFAGELSARGVSRGGFAEISGKSTLEMVGEVDLTSDDGPGGTLLLDPTDITISALGSAGLGGNTISNVWLSQQLDAGTNVVISTNFGNSGSGSITIGRLGSSAEAAADRIEWYQDDVGTPGGSLTLLAMGNINFNSAVRTAGSGDINVVAGWDGVTGWGGDPEGGFGTFDMAAVLATMNDGVASNDAAGLNGGSVFLGSTGSRAGVDVGSRWGDTSLAAANLTMRGSTTVGHGWAQIGFNDNGVEYGLTRTHNGLKLNEWWGSTAGNVLGKDYIALLGGTEFGTGDTGTLGHNAFRGAGWGATGDINVKLSGRLDGRGGTTASYVQIGHGGVLQDGSEWKRDQAVNGVANTLIVTTRDGIQIDPGDNRRSFFSSTWRTNYAGDAARIDGNISVTADRDILLMSARDFDASDNLNTNINTAAYVHIGHGGSENHGSYHGNIDVTAHGKVGDVDVDGYIGLAGLGIQILGGRGTRSYGMIGHGSGYEGNRRTVWDQTKSGDINVTATTGAIRVQAHNQAIRASGSDINFGPLIDPNTPVPTGNTTDNSNLGSFVQIGHGGQYSDFSATGGSFIMPGGINVNSVLPDVSSSGDIKVFAGGTYLDATNADTPIGILVRAGNRRWQHAMIGHGGTNQRGDVATDQTPDFGAGAVTPYGAPTLVASTGYNGDILVEADKGSIIATGGDDFRADRVWGYGLNFTRIGHGGDTVRGRKGGTIDVLAGQGVGALSGDIRFTAGRMFRDHAHLGHGGFDSDGDILGAEGSAEINVTARGSISFVSPESGSKDALGLNTDYASWWFNGQTGQPGFWSTEDRWVQLGHGGRDGIFAMPNRQDINVTAGTGDMGNADGDASTGGILFVSGDMERDYAQLGHGGRVASGNNADGFSGDINVNAYGGGIRFDGSILGAQAIRRDANRSLNGSTVSVVTQGYGGGWEAYVQLGHGGYATRGVHTGDININTWGGIEFLGAPAAPTVARNVTSAPIDAGLNAGTNVWIPLANLRDTAAPVGGAGVYQMPEIHSNIVPGSIVITLSDGTVITDISRNSSDDRASNGADASPNGLFRNGEKVGEVHYDWGLVRFTGSGLTGTWTGTDASASFLTAQGLRERSYAQLGHGGYESDGPNDKANNLVSNRGNISILAGGDIRFEGGAAHRNSAQLGHGGYGNRGSNGGDITIDHIDPDNPLGRVGGLRFVAGHGGHRQFDYHNYAQLGHGGIESDGNHFGNIMVRGTQDADGIGLLVKAGDRQDAYGMIGHGGLNTRTGTTTPDRTFFGLNGNIDIQVGGDVAVVAGTMRTNNPAYVDDGRLFAQIGHGGYDADPTNDNTVFFGQSATDPLLPVGTEGAGDGNWGHFGDITIVSTGGNISFMGASNIPVASRVDFYGNPLGLPADPNGFLTSRGDGRGRIHWAQAGHGGYATGGDHRGNIEVVAENGSVHVVGGMLTNDNSTEKFNSAQIGHGAANASGNIGRADEFIKVHALGESGDVVVFGGEGLRSHGQIGSGNSNNSGLKLADISIIAGNDLRMNSGFGDLVNNWSKIGHGDVRNGGAGKRDGDITVSVGNSISMGRALIGHVDFKASPGFFLGITEGDTYIAMGRRNPTTTGTGQFVTTADSVMASSGGGIFGDLRIYMPNSNSNRIADGTHVNSVGYNRTPAPGSDRADEQMATEHAFPATGPVTEADAVFTPEGDYPFHGFGLYNIYYGGAAPPPPPTQPTTPTVLPPPAPPAPPFDFGPYVFEEDYDAFFRGDELFLYDGYEGMLYSIAYEDAIDDDDSDPQYGGWVFERLLDDSVGDRRYSRTRAERELSDAERDEELSRRKLVASRKVGRGAISFYVFDPATNQYSSYRVFGVPQSQLGVTQ